jgi:hypothetical protein
VCWRLDGRRLQHFFRFLDGSGEPAVEVAKVIHHLGRRSLCLPIVVSNDAIPPTRRRGAHSFGNFALSIALLSQLAPRARSFSHLAGVSRIVPVTAFWSAGNAGRPRRRATSSRSCCVMD